MDAAIEEMPVPGLKEAFRFHMDFGPSVGVGRLATGGQRTILPLTGGHIEGEKLTARLISGSETHLSRLDGVTTIEAVYLVDAGDGSFIRIIGTGCRAEDQSKGFDGVRMTIVFEVDEGSAHSWLATRAFVAERPGDAALLTIAQIV